MVHRFNNYIDVQNRIIPKMAYNVEPKYNAIKEDECIKVNAVYIGIDEELQLSVAKDISGKNYYFDLKEEKFRDITDIELMLSNFKEVYYVYEMFGRY